MSCEVRKKPPFVVQAKYSFTGKNNDELCFKKGDLITVTQIEEGGWWEGTLKDNTGWFPCNYVEDYKLDTSNSSNSPSKPIVNTVLSQNADRTVIINDLIDSERAHYNELSDLVHKFLIPIERSDVLSRDEYNGLVNNINDVLDAHNVLLKSIVDGSLQPSDQQRIGRIFLSLATRLKQIHEHYCTVHPRAVLILEKHRDELSKIMEANGASPPGILVLIAGLSKPFRRLEKYTRILQELKRYMEESHVDRGDISRSISVYKDLSTSCSTIRRQKELELQILNGGVRGWEGDNLANLGDILRIGSVAIGPDRKDRYFVLFFDTLLILSVSTSMTTFVYEGKLPLSGITVTKAEPTENSHLKNAFEIRGPLIEEIIAICQTKEEQQGWIADLNKQITCCKKRHLPHQQQQQSTLSLNAFGSPPHSALYASAAPKLPQHATPLTSIQQQQPPWRITRLRPSPPMKCHLLSSSKTSRNSSTKLCDRSFTEDAQILQVIEGYCSSAKLKYNIGITNSCYAGSANSKGDLNLGLGAMR